MTAKKFKVLITAPAFSRSGYGQWSDSLVPMLINYPMFDAVLDPIQFGACVPRQTATVNDSLMQSRFLKDKQAQTYDICIGINLPCNAVPAGNIYSINFSAGLEVDRMPDYMMEGTHVIDNGRKRRIAGVNNWPLSVVMSKFAKDVYNNSKIKPTKPIEVLNWCMDTEVFKMDATPNAGIDALMNIAEQEAFLYIGQKTSNIPNMDRKNADKLIRLFCEAFKGRPKKPALILKTNGTNFSKYDRNGTIEFIQANKSQVKDNDCSVYLLHGELSDQEMNALYNHPKIIAGISLTRGEGYGGPLLQTTLAGKPLLASNYSGHLDFLPQGSFIPLEGKLEEIPKEAVSEYFIEGSKWFEVDDNDCKQKMLDFYLGDRTEPNKKALALAHTNSVKFSYPSQQKQLYRILDKYLMGK